MSNNNPYAVNGNSSNPYASSNPYGGTGRYADPYSQQNNASSASVNSFRSRDERRRVVERPAGNPYDQPPQRRPSPGPTTSSYDGGDSRRYSPDPGPPPTDPRFGRGPRAGGGYGGLGPIPATTEYDRPAQQTPPTRPRTAGRDQSESSSRETERDSDRSRAYSDSRSRERRHAPDIREMPPPPTIPAATSEYGANRHYSPRRPAKSMDEILKHIKNKWKNMEADECVPVKVALQLMDPSSVGLGDREADFADTHVDLQKSLKKVVNEHYDDFNSAVGTYHKIQTSIRESQSRVRYLKTGLLTTKGSMLTTRPELRSLAEQSGELDNILQILNQMEALREMPARLEERVTEKRWIAAIEVLSEGLRLCRRSDLDGIGAMSDLRSYFASQETSLVDVLVEELHDHLYLKSPYCQDRWKGRRADGGEKNAKETFGGNTWDRPVYQFLHALDARKPMTEDASKNPEADTFRYIQMTLEALNKLGYLEETITRIEQRMPVELYKVVDRTNNEIDVKYPLHLRSQMDKDRDVLKMMNASGGRPQVLSDFLWTLYAKFEAIAESHRVLHEIVMGIVARENLSNQDSYTSGFRELWKLYQMEIRSLLHDYLATDSDTALGKDRTVISTADIFTKKGRDRNRKMFKLADVDQKAPDLKTEADELNQILKDSVPGLVSKSKAEPGVNRIHERNGQDGTAAGHKLLIEPSVFNMTVLLPPSLTFLQHLKDIVPQTSKIAMSTLTSFLDDFLINVFHPQLEEAVTELCTQCMMDMEAFTEDSQWSKHSPHPVFQGTVAFMALIRAFAGMLSSIPQDQMFTQLIINQIVTYYDKSHGFYKAMVSRVITSPNNPNTNTLAWKPAAAYAESGEIHDVGVELFSHGLNESKRLDLTHKAVQLLLAATKANPITAYDIIIDSKSIHQLSLLYNSMQWLSSSLSQLRHVESASSAFKTHSRNASQNMHSNPRRWTLIRNLKTGGGGSSHEPYQAVFLPLNPETAMAFDTTLDSFRQLAKRALLTVHIDIRCGIVHQLGRALRPASNTDNELSTPTNETRKSAPSIESGLYPFVLPAPPTSASPRILELNNDLINFDASISTYLGTKERRFILSGLGRLVDKYLVIGADFIQIMNREGAERMRVDAMVIQQVLRGLGVETTASARQRALLVDNAGDVTSTSIGLGITSPIDGSGSATNGNNSNDNTTSSAAVSDDDAILSLTSRYYELFFQGPDAIMKYVRDKKEASAATTKTNSTTYTPDDQQHQQASAVVEYSYDELRTLVELCFSAVLRGNDREEALKARKKLNDLLLHLGEIMWDS